MKDFGEWISENKNAMHEDVYGLFNDSYKCYRNDIDNTGKVSITDDAINHMKTEIKNNPLPYLKSMVRHDIYRDNTKDIEFIFNEKFPLVELFPTGFYELMNFLLDLNSDDNGVKKVKDVVDCFFRLFKKNNFNSFIVPVDEIDGNGIMNGNYDAYYKLLCEGEKDKK